MALTTLFALLLQDAPAPGNDSTVKIVSGVLAVVLLAIIILRRKSAGKKKDEDEF